MKIRHTSIGKTPSTSISGNNPASSRFRTLLQGEIDATFDTLTPQKQNDANTPSQKPPLTLIEDAAHLLDDIIGQIETDGKPDPASVDSLQQLRKQLTRGQTTAVQQDMNTVIAVETERLKSW
ncbi:MAG: hypothetical protein BMS9Abin18_0556 [Zetaproteobacteria bacterium]|nr:MAG: hypothetical protein BMS9Abin18_0556 [Zetaproteobacteria bacterium]